MSLGEKLKSLAERAAKDEVDWAARKSEWISAVGALYDDIELWLKPWRDDGYLTVAALASYPSRKKRWETMRLIVWRLQPAMRQSYLSPSEEMSLVHSAE